MMLSERASDLVLFGLDDASTFREETEVEPVTAKSQPTQQAPEPASDLDRLEYQCKPFFA